MLRRDKLIERGRLRLQDKWQQYLHDQSVIDETRKTIQRSRRLLARTVPANCIMSPDDRSG